MRTGSPTTVALSRDERTAAWRPGTVHLRRRADPRTRIIRTFVFTFVTWSLFLCYLLAFAV